MCPDKELLSAYTDGELDKEWDKRISSHLETCGTCRRIVESYRSLHNLILSADVPVSENRMEEIYGQIISKENKPAPFWWGKISLPAPIALAAAALFMFLGGLFYSLAINNRPEQIIVYELSNISSFEREWQSDVFPAISSDYNSNDIDLMFAIPEHSGFAVTGEPRFILATEYKRGR